MRDSSDADVIIRSVCLLFMCARSCECNPLSHRVYWYTVRAIWSTEGDKRVIQRPVGVLAIFLPAANVTGSLRCTLQGQVEEQSGRR